MAPGFPLADEDVFAGIHPEAGQCCPRASRRRVPVLERGQRLLQTFCRHAHDDGEPANLSLYAADGCSAEHSGCCNSGKSRTIASCWPRTTVKSLPRQTFVIDALRNQAYLMLAGEISVRYNVLFACNLYLISGRVRLPS